MNIESLLIGVGIGIALGYVLFLLIFKNKTIARSEYRHLEKRLNDTATHLAVSQEKIRDLTDTNQTLNGNLRLKDTESRQFQSHSVSLEARLTGLNERIAEISERLDKEQATNQLQQEEINTYQQNLSELNANNRFLIEKLDTQKKEIEELQRTAHLQFEKIANRLFEEKSEKFTLANKSSLEQLLTPFKEDIQRFKVKVEETYDKESKQRFSLEEKVKDLVEQTNKISAEANNLAMALKGNPQKRGSWGEMILERILEASGLTKDREYFVQESAKKEDGTLIRPDVKVLLPDKRMIIVDSKVSLIAYDKFSATQNTGEQKIFLNEHISALKTHIDQLSSKKYDDLQNSLDFTMMFIPIEPAYLLAVQADQDLWAYAYSKRILLVSPTNLIASLKIISDLWKRDQQSRNAMKIVERGEAMYEKLVGFVKTFEEIGTSIKSSQEKYDKAFSQLKEGRGNLINQAVKLKSLGLKSDKSLPEQLTDSVDLE